jgi:hypothetical protein
MKKDIIKDLIKHQKIWIKSDLPFDRWVENYLKNYLELEKEYKDQTIKEISDIAFKYISNPFDALNYLKEIKKFIQESDKQSN